MNSNKITNLATPTADTDAATKAYVDAAAPAAYITTTRGANSTADCGGSYPGSFCPTGWTVVTSWTYCTLAGSYPNNYYKNDWTETLCTK
jgi:hypothetical protein